MLLGNIGFKLKRTFEALNIGLKTKFASMVRHLQACVSTSFQYLGAKNFEKDYQNSNKTGSFELLIITITDR